MRVKETKGGPTVPRIRRGGRIKKKQASTNLEDEKRSNHHEQNHETTGTKGREYGDIRMKNLCDGGE